MSLPDEIGRAFGLYKAAQAALYRCNTNEAAVLFKKAAEIYKWQANMPPDYNGDLRSDLDKDRYNYSCGACYFMGGLYDLAVPELYRCNFSRMPSQESILAQEVLIACRVRLEKDYWNMVLYDLIHMRKGNHHKDIIALLKGHPYLLPAREFAMQMRDSCRQLGHHVVADLFDRDYNNLSLKVKTNDF